MTKLWAGRTAAETAQLADDFNSSIAFDSRMAKQDITGSMAHAAMLGAKGIITEDEAARLIDGLQGILDDLESGALPIDMQAEDIHMFVEQVLTQRLGEVGKKLHTARSRNDQVALDFRMYLRDEIDTLTDLTKTLAAVLCDKAEEYKDGPARHLRAPAHGLRDDARARSRAARGLPTTAECVAHRLLRPRGDDLRHGPGDGGQSPRL